MRAYVEVDLAAIKANIQKFAKDQEVLAVVKADAYGHGLVPVATAALEAGASWLGVALLEEALALRAAGITAPVIAWLTPPGENFAQALKSQIDLSVPSVKICEEILDAAHRVGIKPRIHLEVDTGMHRGGVLDEWDALLELLVARKSEYELVGFWTHFARADEPSESYTELALTVFEEKLTLARAAGLAPAIIHCANSAATINFPGSHRTMVRLGIATYGLSPDVTTMGNSSDLGLTPAMNIYAKLQLVKSVRKGDAIGYGGVGVATQDTTIGVVVMGYSDGIPRGADSRAGVYHDGKRAPLIGRVSMDQCVVDLGPGSRASAGDYVALISADGYTADDWAAASNTINYEIVTRIATRVPRKYL